MTTITVTIPRPKDVRCTRAVGWSSNYFAAVEYGNDEGEVEVAVGEILRAMEKSTPLLAGDIRLLSKADMRTRVAELLAAEDRYCAVIEKRANQIDDLDARVLELEREVETLRKLVKLKESWT